MIINITGDKVESQVFWNYLTEYYHVENNEMISLNEEEFDIIPDYIMKMADSIVADIFEQ